jgi:hypothetical protein
MMQHLTPLTHSQLHLLSASVNDVDVVCVDGPAHQIMIALGWCDAQMPVLEGLQTRFFEASRGNIAAGCFAPLAVSLKFVAECAALRTEYLSQEESLQGGCSGGWRGRVPSFPVHELCFSQESGMLEHIASNTTVALEAVGHQHVIASFVLDWFNRGALRRISDHKLWLVCCRRDVCAPFLCDNFDRLAPSSSTMTQIRWY